MTKIIYFFGVIFYCFNFTFAGNPKICPPILSRKDWGGTKPMQVDYAIFPLEYVVVHHTVTKTCNTKETCSEIVRNIQEFHIDDLDFNDIGYNFLIGDDGNVYEGAGWHKVGAHTRGYNIRSMGLALIGDFMNISPSDKQLQTAKDFLQCAVELGELETDFKLIGAKQVSATASPGRKLYREIKKWPNYVSDPKQKNP